MINTYSGWPGKVVSGEGALLTVGGEVKALGGSRVMLFTDNGLRPLGFVADAVKAMEESGLAVSIFSDIDPNPTDKMVEAAVALMREFAPDAIVAVGGGSPMDCAKAANVLYTHGGDIEDYNVNTGGVTRIENKLLPFIAVPTTAGTGSEVTNVGVIVSTRRHVKYGVLSPLLVPDTAILDPVVTVGLSPYTTAATGIDALTHCIESYVSTVSFCIADAEALYGVSMVCKYLPLAYADGKNLHAREQMLLASMMAGASFNINNLGLCHQMAHQLGSYFGIAHGVANALLLPRVMRFNLSACPEKYADLARAMGCDTTGLTAEEAAKRGIAHVESMCRSMGIPEYLDDLGVDKARVPEMAVTALQDGCGATNPVATTVGQCEKVYYECFKS